MSHLSVMGLSLTVLFFGVSTATSPVAGEEREPLTMLVMDPLALPLSCPCVKGHAQRRYDKLAAFLEKQLDQPVKVLFSDDLSKALRTQSKNIDIVIGKSSVVQFDAKINQLVVRPMMMLTGQDGRTTVTGMMVVRKDDPATKLEDLRGYRVLFGPPECDEKFKAAAEALQRAGVALPAKFESRPGCSDSVVEMLESPAEPTVAVISSYAAALLEGCGTVKKDSIRIIGQTRPVPFVTVFFTNRVGERQGKQIIETLLSVKTAPDLLMAMESAAGFVPMAEAAKDAKRPLQSVEVIKKN
jgi:ABC-type phosphate/phosphonate transport system substrate-binding protein